MAGGVGVGAATLAACGAGAQEAMADIDPDLVEDPWIFPTPELLATVSEFMTLGVETRMAYDRQFQKAVNM